MDPALASPGVLMQTVNHWIWIIGTGIDLFGVVILLAAIGWTSHLFVKRSMGEQHYDAYTLRIGRSLLFSLPVLITTDIVKTIASEPTFVSLGVLVGLVLVRNFVNWLLVLEVEGLALSQAEALPVRVQSHLPSLSTRVPSPLSSNAQK
jgi:uncharacterized membrane protein